MAFGFLGKAVKAGLGAIGDVAKVAAPAATFIPGVGPVAAAAIGAGGGLLGRLNDSDGRGAGGTVGDALKFGAVGGGGAFALDRLGGSPGSVFGKIGGLIESDPALAAQILTGGLGIIQGARSQGEAQDILRDLLAQQQQREDSLAPIREQALKGLSGGVGAVQPDLSHIFRSQNAFGRLN